MEAATVAKRGRNLKDPTTVPRHGPHAACEWLACEGRWRVTLTESGRALVASLYAKYPTPVTLLTVPAPKLFSLAARARNENSDAAGELDQAAAAGVCQAATYFDEGQAAGSFEAFASWHVRAAVGRWLRKRGRPAASLSGFEAAPERPVRGEVRAILSRLPVRERKVLAAAFGLHGPASPVNTWQARKRLQAALAAAKAAALSN